jgi:hypothetical protein
MYTVYDVKAMSRNKLKLIYLFPVSRSYNNKSVFLMCIISQLTVSLI